MGKSFSYRMAGSENFNLDLFQDSFQYFVSKKFIVSGQFLDALTFSSIRASGFYFSLLVFGWGSIHI